MKKIVLLVLLFVMVATMSSCGSKPITSSTTEEPSTTIPSTEPSSTTTEQKEDDSYMSKTLVLKIDNQEVNVYWMDNNSAKELKKLAQDTLTITLEKYGDFEQFGSIGHILPSNDERLTANVGDIMLYQSNKIVLFYGSNTYSYTKLGHINLSKTELEELLGEEDSVTITLSLK